MNVSKMYRRKRSFAIRICKIIKNITAVSSRELIFQTVLFHFINKIASIILIVILLIHLKLYMLTVFKQVAQSNGQAFIARV